MKVTKMFSQHLSISAFSKKDLLDQVKTSYDCLIAKHHIDPETIKRIEIEPELEYGSTYIELQITVYREETSFECTQRLAREEKDKEWKRKQYEQLKKEFGE